MKLFELLSSHGHERLAFHHDAATGLRAIIAIHSTALGNALGGTRRWAYSDEAEAIRDVLRLSEGMTYKAAAADLPMGGAKSVILATAGNPATEAEARAMGRFGRHAAQSPPAAPLRLPVADAACASPPLHPPQDGWQELFPPWWDTH